jgi:voltage-gated potassium channel
MSVVYQELLTYSDSSNEFYFVDAQSYPPELVGMTFEELSQWLTRYSTTHPEGPVLLVGVKRGNGQILLNPKRSHFERLRSDDALIVMAFLPVDLLQSARRS